LQIMLRTHGELGYKQEQRFHLELGLLKMSHAQRILPIEQLLSDAAGSSSSSTSAAPRTPARPAIVSSASSAPSIAQARPNQVSPFAADSARKGNPRQESAAEPAAVGGPRIVAAGSSPPRVIMGSAAPASIGESAAEMQLSSQAQPGPDAKLQAEPSPASNAQGSNASIERLQGAVLQALMDGNQRILVSMLEAGEWSVEGNEVVIKISESQTVVDMSLSAEARRLAIASASGVLGRAAKLKIVPGASVATTEKRNGTALRSSSGSGVTNPGATGRSRAEQDAVVQRLREKFGAEIRTVIDYKEKR
jgi:DNA polymerase-3 subunit gamma/tau